MLDSVYNVQLFTHLRPDAITNTLVSIHGPCVAARTRCKLYINFSDARSCEIMLLRLHHKTSSWQLCNPGKFRELVVKVVSELLTLSVIIQLPHVSFIQVFLQQKYLFPQVRGTSVIHLRQFSSSYFFFPFLRASTTGATDSTPFLRANSAYGSAPDPPEDKSVQP